MEYEYIIHVTTTCKITGRITADHPAELAKLMSSRVNECQELTPAEATVARRDVLLMDIHEVPPVTDLPVGY